MPPIDRSPGKTRRSFSLTSASEGVLEKLRAVCLSLPETTEKNSFGHPNFQAGKKTFVAFEQFNGRPSIAFRLDRREIERLSESSLFFPTPYGRGQWLSLWVDGPFDWDLVKKLVIASYRLVALRRMILKLDSL